MDMKAFTSSRVARRMNHPLPTLQESTIEASRELATKPLPDLRKKLVTLVRNPLFLVILTWMVMAGLLVMEIIGGK